MIPARKYVISGFDKDDERQERALGHLMAQRLHPGNKWAAILRGRARVGIWRKKEAKWNSIRVDLTGAEKATIGLRMDQIEVHEYLDLLPHVMDRKKAEEILLSNDGRKIARLGRIIRKRLVEKASDQPR